ncbi:carboxymuconolactone decarboxylase family protein [Bradyrhizobium sp. AS23.2]|uniref:carboxymuconolactone decarboxylase family protein n=1 Tax=Bradyrhizobium sp. AS23.2 TaxID=1680155 RepID=UPI00093F61E4|nr:carboxymuconolactone decarboxylase family protein [Bradyrhizobium sp. AS23.2]OKO74273.1 carboxymuconolactone decarboxylase [Bradyrhizobium sp. AS23.2]
MSRIPYFDMDQATPELQELLKIRRPLNLYRMLPHATTIAPGFLKMGGAILRDSAIDPVLREIAILRVGFLSKAAYETHQHKRVARNAGISDTKIAALENDASDSEVFSPLERLVILYTDDVVANVKASTALFDELLAQLDHRRMAELTLTVGFYMMVSRFLENFDVDIEAQATSDGQVKYASN